MADNDLANGVYFNLPHERAPEFVLGSLSIQPERFIEWLQAQQTNAKGYVRLSIKRARGTGKPYLALDTWEPSGQNRTQSGPTLPADDFDDDIPF